MSKLAKLTSAIRKLGRSKSAVVASSSASALRADLRTVLVGKSRRRYLLRTDLVEHPLIRCLVDQSASECSEDGGALVVACEVVMFEHLLWMLENSESQLANYSMDELVEFYSY
uniref:Small auxin up regulated protein n=1 Tax=Kalanchoe fedtschenkoi TaxID=63787 RepID=A0A7N0TYI0_KALFE